MTGGAPPSQTRGLQAERTELAWVRTALASGGLALTTSSLAGGTTGRLATLATGGAIAAVGLAAAVHRLGYLRRHRRPATVPRAAAALLAASVVAANMLAVVLVVARGPGDG